jgi:hypothetical protein
LRQIVQATREVLLDAYDARAWGEALAASGEAGQDFLKELLLDPTPWIYLGAAYGLACQPIPDRDLEVLAELLSFHPLPEVRVVAAEIRADSQLPDPLGVSARLLTNSQTRAQMDGWLWSLACEDLPPEELPTILRNIEEEGNPDPEDIATLLEESSHPLAVPLLASRLLTAAEEQRGSFLDALERREAPLDRETLARFDLSMAADRVLILRAQEGEAQAQEGVFERILSGALGAEELAAPEQTLLCQALIPRALDALKDAPAPRWARILSHLRRVLPPRQRSPTPREWLRHEDPLVCQQAYLNLLESPAPADRKRLRAQLPGATSEIKLGLLEHLNRLPPVPDQAPIWNLTHDQDSRVRFQAFVVLLSWATEPQSCPLLRRALQDGFAPNRAEFLSLAREEKLPVEVAQIHLLLFDVLPGVRAEAAQLLVEYPSAETIDWLQNCLQEERVPWVRTLLMRLLQDLAKKNTDHPEVAQQ